MSRVPQSQKWIPWFSAPFNELVFTNNAQFPNLTLKKRICQIRQINRIRQSRHPRDAKYKGDPWDSRIAVNHDGGARFGTRSIIIEKET